MTTLNASHRWTRSRTRAALLLSGALACAALTGCDSAGEGFVSGAGLGALGGMAIGSAGGHMGRGAAVGAVIGAIGGAIIGDQNQRAERYSYGGPAYYYGPPPGGPDGQWVYVGGGGCREWAWRGDRWCR